MSFANVDHGIYLFGCESNFDFDKSPLECNHQGTNYKNEDVKKTAQAIANFFISEIKVNFELNSQCSSLASATYHLNCDLTKQENAKKLLNYLKTSEYVSINESSPFRDLINKLSENAAEDYDCSTHPSFGCLDNLLWHFAIYIRQKASMLIASFDNPSNLGYKIDICGNKVVEVCIIKNESEEKIKLFKRNSLGL